MSAVEITTADAAPPVAEAQEVVQTVQQSGGSFASALDAGMRRLKQDSERLFPVPGWLRDPDQPVETLEQIVANSTMAIRARKLGEKEAGKAAGSKATYIAMSTAAVLMVLRDGGELEEVPGGWQGLAQQGGWSATETSAIVSRVTGDADAALQTLYDLLYAWNTGYMAQVEQALGE